MSESIAIIANGSDVTTSVDQKIVSIPYTAQLTYLYNGVFQVGGAGGASKLFT